MTDLSTTYMGIHLKNPLIVGACPISSYIDRVQLAEHAGADLAHEIDAGMAEQFNLAGRYSFQPAPDDVCIGSDQAIVADLQGMARIGSEYRVFHDDALTTDFDAPAFGTDLGSEENPATGFNPNVST